MSARSNAQKLAVINRPPSTMRKQELSAWLMTAAQQGVISPNVRQEAMKGLR
jgi:hypothetical protein